MSSHVWPAQQPPIERQTGLSLLELTAVVALAAILLAFAVPSYQQYLARAHRANAIELLLASASCQERVYASEFHYDTRRCRLADASGHYVLSYEPADTLGTTVFTVTADPQAAQAADACGSLSLDQSGNRAISGPQGRMRRCWEGR